YPDAPATRTLFTERPPDPLDRSLDRGAPLGDLLVGESPVGGSEAEPQGEALAPLAHLLAAVEGEDLRPAQQLAAAAPTRLAHRGRRALLADDDRDVLVDGRIGDHVLVGLLAVGRLRDERRQVDLEARGGGQIPLPADQGVDLADPAGLHAPDDHPG